MKRFFKHLLYLLIAGLGSFGLIHELAIPVLSNYHRLAHTMARFAYTEATLMLFVFLSIWLFFLQLERKHFWAVYLYLFYAIYLFLLFTVLFAKANKYRAYSFDLFDFLVWDRRTIEEAFLNVFYFIPLGVLYGFKARTGEFVFVALLTILGIETMQYVFYLGTFALSDILLNFIGCSIGFVMLRLLMRHRMTGIN